MADVSDFVESETTRASPVRVLVGQADRRTESQQFDQELLDK